MSGTIESQLRYHAKHPDTPPPLRGLMLRAVEELRYRAMVIEQRNAEIKRGHDDFVQAITDPENQPSQWGTVTLAMYEKLELDTAAPAPVAQQGEQAKPAAYITDTWQGPMVWTPEMYDEACTYCDDGEFPVPLYTAAPKVKGDGS